VKKILPKNPKGSICKIDDCEKKAIARLMCNQHYKMWNKYGDPLAGAYRMPFKKALDNGDGTRTCTKCKKKLPISAFHKDKQATGGLRATCKKCRINHVKNWYQDNRERQSGKEKVRRHSNKEKYTEKEAKRYIKDREKRIALATEHSHLRRTRKKETKSERGISKLSLKRKLGTKCYYCGKEMDFKVGVGRKFNRDMATIEHLIPLAKGGEHTFENTVLACRHCNLSKSAKSESEFEEGNENR
jgi:5-methylcytosine-specific restriction endonuclease McrA